MEKEKSLEEKTEQMIDKTLEYLKKYDINKSKKERRSFVVNMDIDCIYDDMIMIEQFIMENRKDYTHEQIFKFNIYLGILNRLASYTNSIKYYEILR